MTAPELLDHLQDMGVALSLAPEGQLRCLAPRGVLTPALAEALREAKAALVALLAEESATPPEPMRSYRQWRSGHIPQTAKIPMAEPLPEAKYSDKPSPCKTYVGRPCTVKACTGNRTRFWPTRMCTQCWTRLPKTTTPD